MPYSPRSTVQPKSSRVSEITQAGGEGLPNVAGFLDHLYCRRTLGGVRSAGFSKGVRQRRCQHAPAASPPKLERDAPHIGVTWDSVQLRRTCESYGKSSCNATQVPEMQPTDSFVWGMYVCKVVHKHDFGVRFRGIETAFNTPTGEKVKLSHDPFGEWFLASTLDVPKRKEKSALLTHTRRG